MIFTKIAPAILVGAIAALVASTASGQTLGVNFPSTGQNGTTNDAVTGPAGLVPLTAAQWLNVSTNAGGPTATPEGPTVTWTSPNSWGQTNTNPLADGNSQLGAGYLDSGNTAGSGATITFNGLSNGVYDVYVFARRNEGPAAADPLSEYLINGVQTNVSTGNVDPTGGNWITSTNNAAPGNLAELLGTTVSGGTLVIQSENQGAAFRSPVDGVELVQSVPEPASVGLLTAGAVGLLGLRRRRSA